MDIISFGLASSASRENVISKEDVGVNAKASYPTVDKRIDALQENVERAYSLTDNIIVNNAVNIVKAELRINAMILSGQSNMTNMLIDDLFNISNIDTLNSSYTFQPSYNRIYGGTVVTKPTVITGATKLMITAEVSNTYTLEISIDGQAWQTIESEKIIKLNKPAINVKIRFGLYTDRYLNAYSLLWA